VAKYKLVCDRCGFEITERDDIALAMEGADAWKASRRARGIEPRGEFPCKYHMQDEGEMLLISEKEEKKLRKRIAAQS